MLRSRGAAGKSRPRKPRKNLRRLRLAVLWRGVRKCWPGVHWRRRTARALRHAPLTLLALIVLSGTVVLWFALNGIYQVVRKPTELFFPVSGTLNKTPPETWRRYGPLFQEYATELISPELLAALAQVEGSGNPVARTYWRWSFKPRPFEVYRPASSAVGMYQMTNGTFAAARRYCIRHHVVVEAGPWNNWESCWFNGWYTRVLPSHAIELTSAYLDRSVAGALAHRHANSASLGRRQELAAVIHLCGAGAGDIYVQRGLRLAEGQRCGDHDARDYVARVAAAMRIFAALRSNAPPP